MPSTPFKGLKTCKPSCFSEPILSEIRLALALERAPSLLLPLALRTAENERFNSEALSRKYGFYTHLFFHLNVSEQQDAPPRLVHPAVQRVAPEVRGRLQMQWHADTSTSWSNSTNLLRRFIAETVISASTEQKLWGASQGRPEAFR